MNSKFPVFPNENSAFVQHAIAKQSIHDQNNVLPAMPEQDTMHQDELSDDLTLRQKLHEVREAAAYDFKNSGIRQKIGLLATGAWLTYEWGPGNETVTPILGGAIINSVSGPAGIAVTAAVTGGFTFLQQVASGATVAATATQFPKLTETTFNRFFTDKEHPELNAKPWKDLSLAKRILYGFTMGTTFVASREAAVTGETKFAKTLPRVIGSAALTSSVVATLAGGVEALDTYSDNFTPILQKISETFVDVVSNPITWLGLLGVSALNERRKRKNIRKELAAKQS